MTWGIVFDIIIVIIGVICDITAYTMKTSGKLKIGWFVGQDIVVKDKAKIKEYIDFVYMKFMVFGSVTVGIGLLMTILELVGKGNFYVLLVEFVLLMALIIYYGIFQHWLKKTANKKLQ